MKKLLLSAFIAVVPFLGKAQVFQEDFDGNGPGIAAWTTINDNNTPNVNVAFISNAWNRIDRLGANGNFGGPAGNYAAMSTSWFTPAGTADRWLISPSITLPANPAALKWDAKAQDPEFPDGYKVMLSTNGGATKADFDVELFSTTGEDAAWKSREANLAAYANTSIRIAFVENSTDMFMILVDNVKVEAAPTAPPNCATLTSPTNAQTNVDYYSVPLTWTAPTSGPAPTSYDLYMDTNANPTTLVTNTALLTYTATNLLANTTYYWKAVPKNVVGPATGCQTFSFTTGAAAYCPAGATSTSFEKIGNVTFSNINNNSTSTAGYEDFTAVIGNVVKGQSYPFTATALASSYDSDQVIVWIDFNQDKTFSNDEQVLITSASKSPWEGTITIPTTALSGDTRMRVRMHDSSLGGNATPCGTSSFGQVEDYTVNISTLATNEASKASVKGYPNPVKDVYNIEAQGKIKSVKVFDASGKQILTHGANASKSQIDFSRMTKGVYIVSVELEDGKSTATKVTKQ